MIYRCEYFQRHSEGSSHHNTNKLEMLLNEFGADGWELVHITPTSIGFLLIFRKP